MAERESNKQKEKTDVSKGGVVGFTQPEYLQKEHISQSGWMKKIRSQMNLRGRLGGEVTMDAGNLQKEDSFDPKEQ